VAGIAQPAAFKRLVQRQGARVVGAWWARDHHRLPHRHLQRAAVRRPDLILCTEKDLVRMTGQSAARDLVALTCTTSISRGRTHLERAVSACFDC
jgi:tetraacyldisaccharide-1-P 4'-kinase